MEYTVLARRFRPQAFAEVIGQQNVAQALRNAITGDRVAHAYLFTGARGVGKTSMARILAKSLNCPAAVDGNPCNECDVCQAISAGSDVDVLEIDGASNRGIEDIRSLRANVNVRSMRSRYKIYIIDEVHMLTREAFNALLKTLEEPPPSVKFIFCTTEPQKVPDTILSRCQRFDFGTIATQSIMHRLQQISEAEGVYVAPEALDLVARRAAGSMRDSQSLFDQLLAFGGQEISAADVHRLLGTASDERLIELAGALAARRRDEVLQVFQQALGDGVQLSELIDQLLSYLRDLMVLAAGATEAELLSVSSERRPVLLQQAADWGLQTIVAAMQILGEARSRMSGVNYARVLAELALVRISLLEDLESLSALVQQLKSGQFPGGGTPAAGSRATAEAGRPLQRPAAFQRPSPQNEKKNDVRGGEELSPPTEVTVQSSPPVAFEPGNESAVWSKVLGRLTDMTHTHAKNISRVAITGPNSLVLTLSKRYHLTKTHFERPDQLSRLEKLVAEAVGRPVRISLTVADDHDQPAAPPKSQAASPVRDPKTSSDPFVQQALEVFGASIVKQENVLPPAGT